MGIRPNILRDKAAQENTTPQRLVTDALKKRGSVLGASKELGVTPNTVRYWLNQMGLKARTSYAVTLEKDA